MRKAVGMLPNNSLAILIAKFCNNFAFQPFFVLFAITSRTSSIQAGCKDSLHLFNPNSSLSPGLNIRFPSSTSRWRDAVVDEKRQMAKLVVYPTQPQSLLQQRSLFSSTIKIKQFVLRGKSSFHDFITVVMIPAGVSFKAYSGKSVAP